MIYPIKFPEMSPKFKAIYNQLQKEVISTRVKILAPKDAFFYNIEDEDELLIHVYKQCGRDWDKVQKTVDNARDTCLLAFENGEQYVVSICECGEHPNVSNPMLPAFLGTHPMKDVEGIKKFINSKVGDMLAKSN